jgi:glyoxylase-like metal-dependent hydrolase (beta-lactamase superfamily II)
MRIGALEILPVYDGDGHESGRTSLTQPDHPGDPWACHADELDEHGDLRFTLGGFLVRTGDRVILIDTGAGTVRNDHYAGGAFLDSLRAHGVEPADVTDVLFTHLHWDHVGWATRKGEVIFPNATHRVHAADWAHFVTGPDAVPGAVRKLTPLTDRLAPFDADTTLAPGLDTRHLPGHTPGTTAYILSSQGERALLLGDIAHSTVELTDPRWEAVFDVDKAAGKAVRAKLAAELTDGPDLVAAAHFPGLRFGRLVTVAGERRWEYCQEDD